jgi:hypothetical protein
VYALNKDVKISFTVFTTASKSAAEAFADALYRHAAELKFARSPRVIDRGCGAWGVDIYYGWELVGPKFADALEEFHTLARNINANCGAVRFRGSLHLDRKPAIVGAA